MAEVCGCQELQLVWEVPQFLYPSAFSDYNELVVFGPDDEKPVNLIPTGLGSFRKKATEYFSECPELVKKIDEKIYKSEDLKQVVIEYNNCK